MNIKNEVYIKLIIICFQLQYYEILTNKVRSEYEKLNYTTPEISLADMDKWQTVAKSYTFLPKLNGKRNNVSILKQMKNFICNNFETELN